MSDKELLKTIQNDIKNIDKLFKEQQSWKNTQSTYIMLTL